jgi:hypothetical protein
LTPIAFAPVDAALEPAAADEWLDHNGLRVGLADVVSGQRPSGAHFFGEGLEGALCGCRDDDALLDRDGGVGARPSASSGR